jgi:DNA-directed RNA polymerase beta subunit
MISDFLMKSKKTKATKSEKTTKKSKKSKKSLDTVDDSGIVLIDDDLEVDAEKELEERKAYLEEARSQESGD